ncbi:MAG TPA: HemK/PrmC family methyltransferase, partial [Solirubrobacterales bacterium]|nr:HemK/PrmC family methyltransferase [Solirubrobacterales bacterium]
MSGAGPGDGGAGAAGGGAGRDEAGAAGAGTTAEALGAAVDALAAAGVDSPRLDAELLLCAATGWERAGLAAHPERGVEPAAARRFGEWVRRRVRREPVAYILGRKHFRHLELACDRRALIPRPETELLVEVALDLLDPLAGGGQGPVVLEVGTGTGAIALAIASERPEWHLIATDTSAEALALAGENARRLDLADRIDLRPAPSATAEVSGKPSAPSTPIAPGEAAATGIPAPDQDAAAGSRAIDLVVANLPYVPDEDWPTLAPEIREYEPRQALLGGPDGLEVIRTVVAQTAAPPKPALPTPAPPRPPRRRCPASRP